MTPMRGEKDKVEACSKWRPLDLISSSLSYVLLMFVLGLPVWWKTTQVYRVSLPYAEIDALAQVKLKVDLLLVSEDAKDGHFWGPKILEHLSDSPSYTFSLNSRVPNTEEKKLLDSAKSLGELDHSLAKLQRNLPVGMLVLFGLPASVSFSLASPISLGNHRSLFFGSNAATPSSVVAVLKEVVLGEAAVNSTLTSLEAPRHEENASDRRGRLRRVPTAAGYDVLFSLLVPEPDRILAEWDAPSAVQKWIIPFVGSLGNFSTFSVKSQLLYLTRLNLRPKQQEGSDEFLVGATDLGLAINPVESRLASHVSSLPGLNFLAYVPPVGESPLYIEKDKGNKLESNSFLLPRWGGVHICNLPDHVQMHKTSLNRVDVAIDTDEVFAVFLTQFRLLIGLQDYEALDVRDKFALLKSPSNSVRDWERDYLYRLRTLEGLGQTRMTLKALAHLLSQISNIVINDDIGERVFTAVMAHATAEKEVAQTGGLGRALEAALEAFKASEEAFFDPSLLALLYFPEDQKYAIYIPLFLPVGIPVIMSLRTLFLFFKTSFKPRPKVD